MLACRLITLPFVVAFVHDEANATVCSAYKQFSTTPVLADEVHLCRCTVVFKTDDELSTTEPTVIQAVGDGPQQVPQLQFITQSNTPVIDTRVSPGTEDNAFGFEGGRVVEQGGVLWLFTAELARAPVDAFMRCALWTAPSASGPWKRVRTIAESNQSFPLRVYWQASGDQTTPSKLQYTAEYYCDTADLHASPWAPMPLWHAAENRWHVLYVGYACDFSEPWLASTGNIFGAVSTVPGLGGISGPYEKYGIVAGANATPPTPNLPAKGWGGLNQIGPYTLPDGSFAAFIGATHIFATAKSPRGPWQLGPTISAISTPLSTFNENPVPSILRNPTNNSTALVVVFDTVAHEGGGFGFASSIDGVHWRNGVDVVLPSGCRTPLGLIQDADGKAATLLFTRRFPDCNNQSAQPADGCGGANCIMPGQCANVYIARFAIQWHDRPKTPAKTDDELSAVKSAWVRGTDTVVSVSATFGYAVSIQNHTWLDDGQVALQCRGNRYSSSKGSMKLIHTSATSGIHPTLGKYDSFTAQWMAGDCAPMNTTIFYFPAWDAFEFETRLPSGAAVTDTLPASMRRTLKKYEPVWGRVSTEFPSFEVPPHEAGLGFVEWAGDALGNMPRVNRPRVANWSNYIGGLTSGPLLVIEGDHEGEKDHPRALMIAPSEAFTVARLMHVGPQGELISVTSAGSDSRIVGGAQGMTTSFPRGYKMSFLLSGRSGVNAAIFGWGRTLQQKHNTSAAKLTLQDDKLSQQLSYLADNGANYCYCDWWRYGKKIGLPNFPNLSTKIAYCAANPSFAGCRPIYRTLNALKAYHKSLQIAVGTYHLDPFWFSQVPFGQCTGATNMSASWYHFNNQTIYDAVGLEMQLFVALIYFPNVYQKEYAFDGSQVAGNESLRFHRALFAHHYNASRLRALVWDGVDSVWLSSDKRVTDVDEQAVWQKGYADAALELKIPMRVDQHLPSDILASVQFGAHTVSRCTGDSPTGGGDDASHWPVLNGNSAFIASLGLRPQLDVLWSSAVQPGNPYNSQVRLDVEHDFIVAVLSTGPLGIGDLLKQTNATLLNQCTRADGVILKPSAAAVLLDRFYGPSHAEFDELFQVTAAPSSLAASTSARLDPAADSRAVLGENPQGELWSWNILSSQSALSTTTSSEMLNLTCGSVTNNTAYSNMVVGMDKSIRTPEACCAACNAFPECAYWNLNWGTVPSAYGCFFKSAGSGAHSQHGVTSGIRAGGVASTGARPLRLVELWPAPPEGTKYWVQEWGNESCASGSAASSCLSSWDADSPLDIDASNSTHAYSQITAKYRLLRAAPVLASGWTVLGELEKFVPVSPQRLVLHTNASGLVRGAVDYGTELGRGSASDELVFDVLGSTSETISIALVTPEGVVQWVEVVGAATVRCNQGACEAS